MKSQVDACRESCSESYKAAHNGGCVAAIAVMAAVAGAKLSGYMPAGMSLPRILLFPSIAYALVFAGRLWKLGRSIKRAKIADELTPMAADIRRLH